MAVDIECILLKETHVWFLIQPTMAAQHAHACLNDATPPSNLSISGSPRGNNNYKNTFKQQPILVIKNTPTAMVIAVTMHMQ